MHLKFSTGKNVKNVRLKFEVIQDALEYNTHLNFSTGKNVKNVGLKFEGIQEALE
jgi:hypothetical protein